MAGAPSDEPPLFAGTILGLRAWSVGIDPGTLRPRLTAHYGSTPWEAGGRWTQAECLSGTHPTGAALPAESCSCGLYALLPTVGHAQELEEVWGHYGIDDPAWATGADEAAVAGIVEAAGRIELHPTGFRAERARPHALIIRRGSRSTVREGVRSVADAYGAKLLEIGSADELVEYCERQGAVLDRGTVERLLEPRSEQGAASAGVPSPVPRPTVPQEDGNRVVRILHATWHAVLFSVLGVLAVLWYAMWALVVVAIAGAILFGWGDEKPFKAPARVERAIADRSRCRAEAVVRATQPIAHLHLRIVAISHSGKDLGQVTRDVGSVPKGTSRVPVAEMKPALCNRPNAFMVRIRAVFGSRAGHVAQVISSPVDSPVRNGRPRATQTP